MNTPRARTVLISAARAFPMLRKLRTSPAPARLTPRAALRVCRWRARRLSLHGNMNQSHRPSHRLPSPRIVTALAMASFATACLVPAGAAAAPSTRLAVGARAVSGGTWGTAREVPGTAALNAGGQAQVGSVSCASAGNCTAAGSYTDSSGHTQAFVVSQVRGTWGTADEVPGTATLNTGGNPGIGPAVSCASPGNCSAGGIYTDSSGHSHAFVASQVGGKWRKAKSLGITTPGPKPVPAIILVSCASAGNCSAGGSYKDSSGHSQAFVVNQADGTWGTAEEVPGTATLNTGGGAGINSLSCAPAGNCSAAGSYTDRTGHSQAFVVSQA